VTIGLTSLLAIAVTPPPTDDLLLVVSASIDFAVDVAMATRTASAYAKMSPSSGTRCSSSDLRCGTSARFTVAARSRCNKYTAYGATSSSVGAQRGKIVRFNQSKRVGKSQLLHWFFFFFFVSCS
jgi:hypothetical protein